MIQINITMTLYPLLVLILLVAISCVYLLSILADITTPYPFDDLTLWELIVLLLGL